MARDRYVDLFECIECKEGRRKEKQKKEHTSLSFQNELLILSLLSFFLCLFLSSCSKDDPNLEDENVKQVADAVVAEMLTRSQIYATDKVNKMNKNEKGKRSNQKQERLLAGFVLFVL